MDLEKTKGLWLLPSSRRVENLHRFFEACFVTNTKTRGVVLVQSDEYEELKEEYSKLWLPEGWAIVSSPFPTHSGRIKEFVKQFMDHDWVGVITDEHIPTTPDWDRLIIEGVQGWNVVGCNDCYQAPHVLGGCFAVSGDILRAVGGLVPDGMESANISDIWGTLCREASCLIYKIDVMVRYVVDTPDIPDGKAQENSEWNTDALRAAGEEVEKLKSKKNILHKSVDVSNIRLMIATPSGSGRFVTDYVSSLFGTFQLLNEKGVPHQWIIENGNADIADARAELLSTFYNSDYTHLLMIDDDMGWSPDVLGRMLMAGEDFVAIAGRKKRDQPMFAVNPIVDETGEADLTFHRDSATVEVKEIGGAFVLLTRNCVDALVKAYPELKYRKQGSVEKHALFLPMMVDNVYKGEDYAFCHRWRALGGKVYVCPDLPLKHIGQKTYEGAWAQTWTASKEWA